jgi:hypothetical protein
MPSEMTWLAGDKRTLESRLWTDWFSAIPQLRDQFSQIRENDDPFLYNETASVGMLASAASRSGLLALAEYVAIKRGTGRGRPLRNGRCDLWVQDPTSHRAWSFEFKQCYATGGVRRATLERKLRAACSDASAVHSFEADRYFGGLMILGDDENALGGNCVATVETLAAEMTYACRISGGTTPVWVLLLDINQEDWRKFLSK